MKNSINFVFAILLFSSMAFGQQNVVWENLVYCAPTTEGIIKNSGGTNWNAGATSQQILAADTDGYVEFTIGPLNHVYLVGLSDANPDAGYSSIKYAVLVQNTQLNIFESGTNIGVIGTANTGIVVRIERRGTDVIYTLDGNIKRTVNGATNAALMVDCTIKQQDSELQNAVVSFGAQSGTTISEDLTLESNLIIGNNKANGYRLSVDGRIICEELRVDYSGDWPDYVFAPDYNLISLKELKAFIQKNGHLPGIQSASNIEIEQGVDVGTLQKTLLEKIEELTLYVIDLEERLEEVEKK